MENLVFREEQKFRQPLMYVVFIILLVLSVLLTYGCIQQICFSIPFGPHPENSPFLISDTLFAAGLLIYLYLYRLETRMDETGIYYRRYPIQTRFRFIKWDNITGMEMMSHGFIGFGVKLTKFGRAYTMGGKKGLRVALKSGERVIFDTQKEQELNIFLQELKGKFYNSVFSMN